jgi:hypothetical protein
MLKDTRYRSMKFQRLITTFLQSYPISTVEVEAPIALRTCVENSCTFLIEVE